MPSDVTPRESTEAANDGAKNAADPHATVAQPSAVDPFDTVRGGSPPPECSLDTTVPYVELKVPSSSKPPQIGRYEILGEIARGGMGVVYRAFDPQLDRTIALKLIKSGELADGDQIERFQTEAKAAAQLDHPGIVQVYEVGQFGGQHFMAMAYIDGHSLWQEVKESPLAPKRAAKLMQQVAEAIQFAHERGIVHRDLKPQNILLTKDGQPKVTDFGLAKRQEHDGSLTQTGQALGTPSYMPPEQAKGEVKSIGPLADVYSLGATLYCLLTGRPPYQAATQLETMLQVVEQEPVSPTKLNPSVPRDLETVCLKCLQKSAGQRYATARELSEELDRFLKGEPIRARPVSRMERGWRWCRRNPVVAGLLSAAVALLVAVTTVSTLAYLREARLVHDKDDLLTQKQTLITEKDGLITEKVQLADKERTERARAEQREQDLRLEFAKTSFGHGVSEHAAGRPQNAQYDFVKAITLLPSDHELRPAYLRVIWDRITHSGRSLFPTLRHQEAVSVASFSPDGTCILTASLDKTAQLWDAQTGAPLGEPLRHEASVHSASFSPDGTRVVTASRGNTARLWDAQTGVPLGEPLRHDHSVNSASFSPDGTRIITASLDKTARLWDAQTGAPLGEPLRHEASVQSASFSPDGTRIVTTSQDKTARLWNAQTRVPLGEPLRHESTVQYASFSPDGTRIVTASREDKAARLWSAQTGALLGEPMRHEFSVQAASFSPDGTRIVTASEDKTARLWDAKTGAPLGEPLRHTGTVYSASFSPDGTRVVTASDDHTARLWDAQTGAPLGQPLRHDSWLNSASFSPDGTRVVTASADHTARLWDATTSMTVEALQRWATVWTASFSPDGTRIVTASLDKTAQLWDAQTGAPLGEPLRHESSVWSASFSPDGTRIVTACRDGTARLWDVQTGTLLGEPLRHDLVWSASFSPDGTRIVTSTSDQTEGSDHTARLWDAQTGTLLSEPLQHGPWLKSASFSPDGTRIVTVSSNGRGDPTARLWDAQTGAPLGQPLRHDSWLNSASFSPDAMRIVTASRDGTARLWDALTGARLAEPLRHDSGVNSASFSPDGSRILTASWDKTARLWDAETGEPLGEPLRHDHWVNSASFSPDGTRIVTTCRDGTARLWDAQTGTPLGEPLQHDSGVNSASFSPDGSRILTANWDKTARLWQVEQPIQVIEDELRFLCLFTGLQADERAEVSWMSHAALREGWSEFLQRHEPWGQRTRERQLERRLQFHRTSAQAAEHAQNWYAAAFHLGWLLKDDPQNESLKSRYDQALAKLQELNISPPPRS